MLENNAKYFKDKSMQNISKTKSLGHNGKTRIQVQ